MSDHDLIVTAAGGVPIPCNKSAMIASSGYFAQYLQQTSGHTPLTLDLPTVPADMFKTLLLYIYTGHLQITDDNVYQLFWCSQMLQIPSAVIKCSQFLTDKLSRSSSQQTVNDTINVVGEELNGVTKSEHDHDDERRDVAKTGIVKPIARTAVPLLSLSNNSYNYLQPHLASFYSDWFLRYTTSLTRHSYIKTENNPASSSSSNNETKENEGIENISYFNTSQKSIFSRLSTDV